MTDSLAITSIFILGCIHALEPGHGKTFLLAYTIGGKLNFKNILLLTTSLLLSHFGVLALISIAFNMIMTELATNFIHDISHWLGPLVIFLFGSYMFGRAIYKTKHIHSNDCGHKHAQFSETKLGNPIIVGLLTGMLPCASSLAVVMMTGMTPTISEMLHFISIYVMGIALVLFLIVSTFNYTKNIIIDKMNKVQYNINSEYLSGALIMGIGFVYLSYNWFGHTH